MTLSGNLSFVPIDEVLRLLTRSQQQGSVDVFGDGLSGRVFVGKGGIDLATIWDDDNLHRHLVNSGAADVDSLRRITTRETTLAAISENNKEIVDLIREVTVESLFQIADRGDNFEVREGASTPYASPKSFELETLIEDSRDRKKSWEKVREDVPDLSRAVTFRRDLGDREEVTVKADAWRVLSEIGTGASVEEIADQLGTTEFWAARVAARLLQEDLVDLRGTSGVVEEASFGGPIGDDYAAPAQESVEEVAYEEPAEIFSESEAETEEASRAEAEIDDVTSEAEFTQVEDDDDDYGDSWWREPEADTATDESDDADEDSKTPEVVNEGLSEMPSVGDDDDEVEEDTEAFLEKVFSELEDTSEPETDEGHGLLRRRRMGSLRDFSSDS